MDFSLTILGSGGALPAPDRFPTAQCLTVGSEVFLIDAGEGVQVQLTRYGISHQRIRHIFISHLHGDHYLGLMGLLFSMHLARRKDDLHLYSHRGLDSIIQLHLRYANSALSYKLHFHALEEGQRDVILDNQQLTVRSVPMNHRIACTGFLFREKEKPRKLRKELMPEGMLLQHIVRLKAGETVLSEDGQVLFDPAEFTYPAPHRRSYAYCSDTAPSDVIAGMIEGADLLYHEATFLSSESERAAETFHSTAAQAAHVAAQSGAGRLLIGHISARYKDHQAVLNEARAVFPNTELAAEGSTFSLPE